MKIPEYDDNRQTREARTRVDPWEKRGLTEAEYDAILAGNLEREKEARILEFKALIPQLVTAKQVRLAEFIACQFKLDWNSYDTQNSMHAAQMLIQSQTAIPPYKNQLWRDAYAILKGIIGFHSEMIAQANTVHPTPYVAQGNIKYTGSMSLEITEKANKELLRNIGNGRKTRK